MQKILGIGNALVDIMAILDNDQHLSTLGLPKGSMQLVDETTQRAVLSKVKKYIRDERAGGSAANTIHGIARLGGYTAFMGKVGNDDHGRLFRADLEKSGIEALLPVSESPTGKAAALVSPDSQRTFATFLGAAAEIGADDITPDLFLGIRIVHLEGYLLFNHRLIEKAARLAKAAGCMVSLDLASYNVVELNRDFLLELIRNYADIVFANEDEARALTGAEPREALDLIAEMCVLAIVKVGAKGSYIKTDGRVTEVGVIPCQPIDTTGAGDLYAGGFLYGLTQGWNMPKCGKCGALLAGKVIEQIGPKIPEAVWNTILDEINSWK